MQSDTVIRKRTLQEYKAVIKGQIWPSVGFLLGAAVIYFKSDSFIRVWQSLSAPTVYWKDCISPWLMAKAALNGVNPYLPLPQLTRMWLPSANPADHPTPYPPFVALLGLPLGFFSYETVARAWLFLELIYVIATIFLLFRWWGRFPHPLKVALILGLGIIWMPLNEELWQGQFMSFLMLLLVGVWLSLRSGREILGGVLLGGLIAVKMIGSPIVLFLLLKRRWRAVAAAATVVAMANLLAMAVLGPMVVIDYYRKVGSFDARLWRPAEGNLSAWAWGIRLFEGAGFSYHLHPLWTSPTLTTIATYALPLAVLALGLGMAWRATNFDTAFSWLAGVCILFSPIAWYFYFLLAIIPIVVLARRLIAQRLPAESCVLALIFGGLLSIKPTFFDHLAKSYGTPFNIHYHMVGVPFAAGLFTLIPTAALFGLLWLVSRTDNVTPP